MYQVKVKSRQENKYSSKVQICEKNLLKYSNEIFVLDLQIVFVLRYFPPLPFNIKT